MTKGALHLTTVAIGGRAVLIEGRSGSGKSDLALRLIDRGAVLVSDDYTILTVADGEVWASAPTTITARIEVRGLGIVPMAFLSRAPISLIVVLTDAVERLPEREMRELLGMAVPLVRLDGHEHSAPIKVELALRQVIE